MVECPKCHESTNLAIEKIDCNDERAGHIPEGLSGYSIVQCGTCHHEWQIVTRAQILQSLHLWEKGRLA
jgi:hypothetical protein